MSSAVVEHVVADAGAFLKKAPLQDFGKNIYTVKEVVNEIRDKQTRNSLAFLPYQLQFKEPLPEFIQIVTEFSKKTGDYPSLSATDIKVLALTYQLESEVLGVAHLKTEPEVKVEVCSTWRHPEAPVNIAGFHIPSKLLQKGTSDKNVGVRPNCSKSQNSSSPDDAQFNSFQFWRSPLPSIEADLLELLNAETVSAACSSAGATVDELQPAPVSADQCCGESRTAGSVGEEEEAESGSEEEESGDGGWITPRNIRQVQLNMGVQQAPGEVRVGCLTTDFAMQNVLIQIGLHVLSVNGMVIRQTRSYTLRCHACFKSTTNMTKVFCPHCGNKTLKKVAVTVNEDGTLQMHLSKNPKVLNPRGLKYSLPLPQGGKHGNNPHLVEDQRFPQQRLSRKARQKTDVFDPDYVAGASPFAENDIYSRAAGLHLRDEQAGGGRRRTNPNAARKKLVKRR
nr:PREDICTED: RNA-binding protein NOB1 isoform X1 [Lepisosteus oculatus]